MSCMSLPLRSRLGHNLPSERPCPGKLGDAAPVVRSASRHTSSANERSAIEALDCRKGIHVSGYRRGCGGIEAVRVSRGANRRREPHAKRLTMQHALLPNAYNVYIMVACGSGLTPRRRLQI